MPYRKQLSHPITIQEGPLEVFARAGKARAENAAAEARRHERERAAKEAKKHRAEREQRLRAHLAPWFGKLPLTANIAIALGLGFIVALPLLATYGGAAGLAAMLVAAGLVVLLALVAARVASDRFERERAWALERGAPLYGYPELLGASVVDRLDIVLERPAPRALVQDALIGADLVSTRSRVFENSPGDESNVFNVSLSWAAALSATRERVKRTAVVIDALHERYGVRSARFQVRY
ncbi:MAG: hypothetical protein KC503_26440 [Myxococcales bacterium]|nr:hypothetical protein [Myxococcales bacterium]